MCADSWLLTKCDVLTRHVDWQLHDVEITPCELLSESSSVPDFASKSSKNYQLMKLCVISVMTLVRHFPTPQWPGIMKWSGSCAALV
jgi:hypothetical protein